MKSVWVVGSLCLMLWVCPAHAELPDYILDKDYQACAGDGGDPQRNAYCSCIRDDMRGWSEDDYMAIATQAAAKDGATPGKLEELAKQCIAKTLH